MRRVLLLQYVLLYRNNTPASARTNYADPKFEPLDGIPGVPVKRISQESWRENAFCSQFFDSRRVRYAGLKMQSGDLERQMADSAAFLSVLPMYRAVHVTQFD